MLRDGDERAHRKRTHKDHWHIIFWVFLKCFCSLCFFALWKCPVTVGAPCLKESFSFKWALVSGGGALKRRASDTNKSRSPFLCLWATADTWWVIKQQSALSSQSSCVRIFVLISWKINRKTMLLQQPWTQYLLTPPLSLSIHCSFCHWGHGGVDLFILYYTDSKQGR